MPNLLFGCFGCTIENVAIERVCMYITYTVTLGYLETLPHVKISLTNMCLYPVEIRAPVAISTTISVGLNGTYVFTTRPILIANKNQNT